MGRRLSLIALLLAALFSLSALGTTPSARALGTPPVRIFVDGQQVDPGEVLPFIKNDRVMVPLRVISEGLGLKVDWDAQNYRVVISSSPAKDSSLLPVDTLGTHVQIYFDGREIKADDVLPLIVNDRTMVPLRTTFEGMGMKVDWDAVNYRVIVATPQVLPVDSSNKPEELTEEPKELPGAPATGPPAPVAENPSMAKDYAISIMGDSTLTAEQLRALLRENNPQAPDLAELYLRIGEEYGIRGDIAFCQAAKETGWWKFGGLALPEQNNYCGLSVTGRAAAAGEDLRGANPQRVRFIEGKHGAFFDSPADGVEAHIQHLYAYATTAPLPSGKELLDPRFVLVKRGCATCWIDLGGKWATPGFDRGKYSDFADAFAAADTYGHSILSNYYWKAPPFIE